MMRPREPSEGGVGKGLKRKKVEQRGERDSYRCLKAAAGPCARLARCEGPLNSGGQTSVLR